MTPDVVVDIGNSRMKWGICREGRVADVLRLPLDEPAAWDAVFAKLPTPQSAVYRWAVASVNPPALAQFTGWSSHRGSTAIFERYKDLPIHLNVDEPEKVGLDRLCGAVAAKAMVAPGTPAITVDAGTAVTVNLIDAEGVFQGGAIFPGPRLMARALHEHTAKLPLSEPRDDHADSEPLGKNTEAAIRAGILAAFRVGVIDLLASYESLCRVPPQTFLTGGCSHLLEGWYPMDLPKPVTIPALNLEGIRIAAEALP